jgi:regulator of protease activity HflC (stomatin/prohibitin superfamily)
VASDKIFALNATAERKAETFSGYMFLVLLLLIIALQAFGIYNLASERYGTVGMLPIAAVIIGPILLILILPGFFMLQPNQAAAITLFGSYKGTDRATGLRWTWPWLMKKKLSVRANNFISEKIKVNDLRGNPIEMAAQIVWRVVDSAQALFDVDDYKQFVRVQVEAAIRTIGARYPYDDFEHQEVTLRGSHEQVNAELRTELQARLAVAGITVDECGFTHLAYAQELAQAMLRRQQAQAGVAARRTLVEGAVGMVEMALEQLSEQNVVELNDERRAAMVSNLMVVLCADRETQPVVNTGTLYQ